MACHFLHGLFGPGSVPTPVWGDQQNLKLLATALDQGLSVSDTKPTTGLSESAHTIKTAVAWLQKTGKAPLDLHKVSGLSDEQRAAFGFETTAVASDPAASVQNMGVLPFKHLDVASFLAALRFAARYRELKTGSKPIFQVGILTLSVQGMEQQLFAQTLLAEMGEVTDTVWLFRWCVSGLDGQYDEHWRAFDGPVRASMSPQSSSTVTSQRSTTLPYTTNHSSNSNTPSPPNTTPPPRPQTRQKPWHHFHHTLHSDASLFAGPTHFLQGDALLRLARSYSNQEIFQRINAGRPAGECLKSVNVITKRLTNAVRRAALASGRSVEEVRWEIAEAKRERGVRHKGKVDVSGYG